MWNKDKRTSPYDMDLREKVIAFLESGNSQRLASKTFNISKTTVNTWYARYKKEGSYAAKKRIGAKPRILEDNFTKYIRDNQNLTAKDIGKHFRISASGVRYWLKKFRFSFKKKPSAMWSKTIENGKNI